MYTQMVVFLLNYSTADFEKTVSVENNPAYEGDISGIFFPSGEYRLIAGKLMRVKEGLPLQESTPTVAKPTQG